MTSVFQEAPFFLVRAPLFPIEDFFTLLTSDHLETDLLKLFHTRSMLREAILIASPTLYHSLMQFKQAKDPAQLISSLFRYICRMMTRATPFGYFSFIAFGKWGEYTHVNFDLEKLNKRARPDMEWAIQMCDLLQKEKKEEDLFQRNPLIYFSLGRIILPYTRKNKEKVSVRASSLVMCILEKSEKPISKYHLLQQVAAIFPTIDSQKASGVIDTLIEEEILFPIFFPTLLSKNPFQHLFENMPALASQFKKYNLSNLQNVDSEELLKTIEIEMKQQLSTPYLFQVDTASLDEVIISPKVAAELRQAVEVLWKLSPNQLGVPGLRTYHHQFLDRYGMTRIVPLLELLDTNLGLGVPEHYLNLSHEKNERHAPLKPDWENWLAEELTACLKESREEIVITEEIVTQFAEDKNSSYAPLSFDLYCEINANSMECIDKGEFQISIYPITGAGDGCATIGRFLDLLGEEQKEKVQDFLREEELREPESLFAEVSYFPKNARNANVAIHENLRNYTLDLGYGQTSSNSLSLTDIFIGANERGLFLTLRDGKKLTACTMNALNPIIAPLAARLIREISKDGYQLLYPFSLGKLENSPHLPRVRYKNTIFSAAKWNVSLSLIKAHKKESDDAIAKKFSKWADSWSLPQFLLMTLADHRILLDRTHPYHVQQIIHEMKSRPVLLVERTNTKEWIQSNKGRHCSEFVIPFLRNSHYIAPSYTPISYNPIMSSCRWKLPGSEWFYAKIFLNKECDSRFLVHHLQPWISSLESIDTWFFVRYVENGNPHLRVRLKTRTPEQLLSKFHIWINPLVSEGWVKEVALSSYEREVERYGGENAIDRAECFFQADSEAALHLLEIELTKKTSFPNFILAIFSLVDILQGFGLNLPSQINFFSKMGLNKKELEGFREWKPKLSLAIDAFLQGNEEYGIFYQAFQKRKKSQMLSHSQWIPTESVIRSLLHMNCNRLLGTDLILEKKAYLFALHTLLSINQKNRVTADEKLIKAINV